MLAIIEAHPVQYHAPVYRALQTEFGVPVTAIYGSDIGVAGYRDLEFGRSLAWDSDLLTGYETRFLARADRNGESDTNDLRARGATELLKMLNPRVVMLVGYGSRFDREAVYESWRTGLPLIFRAETTDHAALRRKARHWFRNATLRVLYRRFERLLYIGEHSLRHYQRLGVPDSKLTFAPYCVETAPFSCDEDSRLRLRGPVRAELGLSDTDIAVLFAGKISERKGPDLLVRAVKQLPEPLRSRACVCFLGDGQMRAQVESAATEAPAVHAQFLGFQNQTRLSRYYHAADLLVLPSLRGETWGLVVNEALHHGVPCVVSDAVGCAPDLIHPGATGHVFETGSVPSLVRALGDTIALVGNRATRDRCRQQVNRYTVMDAARGIAQAYAQVAQMKNAA